MKTIFKIFLIVGGALLFIGGGIFLVAFAKADFNVRALSHRQYEEFYYEETTKVTSLNLNHSVADIRLVYADTDTLSVTYFQARDARRNIDEITLTQEDGVLSMVQSRKPHFSPSFFNISVDHDVTIKIPKDRVLDIVVNTSTGDISISGGTFTSAQLKTSTGDVRFYGDITTETLSIPTSTGDVDFNGNLTANTLTINVDTGDIDSDGVITVQTVEIQTNTGDIELNLAGEQTDYTIVAETNTGKQNIYSGGNGEKKLSVICSTGDIEIDFR